MNGKLAGERNSGLGTGKHRPPSPSDHKLPTALPGLAHTPRMSHSAQHLRERREPGPESLSVSLHHMKSRYSHFFLILGNNITPKYLRLKKKAINNNFINLCSWGKHKSVQGQEI